MIWKELLTVNLDGMMTNVFFIEVPQGSHLEEYVAELNAQCPCKIKLFPALSSTLRCYEAAYAVMVSGGFPAMKEVAEKLRGYASKPILLPFENWTPTGDEKLFREVKIELSLGDGDIGEEILPWLYHEIDTAVDKRNFDRYLWVYAKDMSVVAILLGPEAPDQQSWQTEVEFAIKEAGFSFPIINDVWLIYV